MAITAFKTFISGEVLIASDLNASLTTIINEVNVHGGEIDTINASPKGRAENMLVNGDFSVWQSGTSFSDVGPTADLYRLERLTTVATVTRQAFTLAQTDVPDNPQYFHRAAVSLGSGAGNYARVEHEHEGVAKVSGTGSANEVTLSFWARADTTENLAVEFVQHFGTGGSPSADVTGIEVTTFNLTTTWTKFTKTFNMPSVSGKTLGDRGDSLKILFWYDAGTDFDARTNALGHQGGTFEMTNIQLEAGSEATGFEYVPPAIQKAHAQQYFDASVQGQKNLIINGDFQEDCWQRGTSHSADGYGSADRWNLQLSGATGSFSQQAHTLGQTDVPGNPDYFGRLDVTVANADAGIQTRIEGVATGASEEVTLSFYAKSAGTIPTGLKTRLTQSFGTGGSPSSDVSVTSTAYTLTSTWQKFTYTTTLSSISGKTLGTTRNNYLAVEFINDVSEVFEIDISNVQLEFGDRATGFEYVSPADQLAKCQRYYQEVTPICGAGPNTTSCNLHFLSVVTMRDTPSLSMTSALVISNDFVTDYTQSSPAVSANQVNASGGRGSFTNFTGLTSSVIYFGLTTDGSLALDAEL